MLKKLVAMYCDYGENVFRHIQNGTRPPFYAIPDYLLIKISMIPALKMGVSTDTMMGTGVVWANTVAESLRNGDGYRDSWNQGMRAGVKTCIDHMVPDDPKDEPSTDELADNIARSADNFAKASMGRQPGAIGYMAGRKAVTKCKKW